MQRSLLLFALFLTSTASISIYNINEHSSSEPDRITKRLCRQYADRDHEKELAPERWQWFIDQGVNLNVEFDWYQSCLAHNSGVLPAQPIEIKNAHLAEY